MAWSEIVFGWLLVAALLALSLFFAWRQLASLRRLRGRPLPDEEARYERSRAYRRLVSCGLTLTLAGLLVALLTVFEPAAQQLAQEREGFDAATAPPLTAEQKQVLRVWGGLVVALLLVLLVVLALAAVDLWSTRRHGLRQFRKLQADRRAMIERQTQRLREERG